MKIRDDIPPPPPMRTGDLPYGAFAAMRPGESVEIEPAARNRVTAWAHRQKANGNGVYTVRRYEGALRMWRVA